MMVIAVILFVTMVHGFGCDPVRPEYTVLNMTKYSLKYVQTIGRHGDRSPTHSYYGDKATFECLAREESHIYIESGKRPSHAATEKVVKIGKDGIYAQDYFWDGSCESGQLTAKGVSQLYNNGREFDEIYRQKYNFIPKIFDPEKIKFRTSGKIRTFHSAQAFAQTFYPLERRKEVLDIEFVSTPYDIETMKPNTKCCPVITPLEKKLAEDDGIAELREKEPFKSAFAKLKRITGFSKSSQYLYDYVDLLHPLVCHNQSLPCKDNECMTMEDYEVLIEENRIENPTFFKHELARFQIGMFANDMIRDYTNHMQSNVLFQYYSGHDTTILPLLSLLGQDLAIHLPYASTLVFEYFNREGEMYVRVLLNNVPLDLSPVCTTNEDGLCTVAEYHQYMKEKCIPTIEECEDDSRYTGVKAEGSRKQKKVISRDGWGSYN